MLQRALILGLVFLLFAAAPAGAQAPVKSEAHAFAVETLFQGKDVIWGFDFLPDGKILFTERGGAMRLLDPASRSAETVTGVPKVRRGGQGGLLDVRVHPEFASNRAVFFSYSEPVGDGDGTTAIARAELRGKDLVGFRKLFSAVPANGNDIHFGSRIELAPGGMLFFTVGDRNDRHKAQDLGTHLGKVLRIREDGSVPEDNPFHGRKGARPEIWSYGHRNPQGLALRPGTRELWEAEFGPRGGDEVNLIKPGLNYGWPVITYGREYWGPSIGEGTSKAGMEQPVVHWVPSISPSAIAFYSGDRFPRWKGNLFLANLSGMHVRRLVLEGTKVTHQEPLLSDLKIRFRNVREGRDGALYLSTDDGRILRLIPR